LEGQLLLFDWQRSSNAAQTAVADLECFMAIISRGFSGRRSGAEAKLPPGQYLTTDFPVLSAGPTPRISLDRWEFTIDDGRNVLKRWDWKSFRELPTESITVDIHCVTRWSKLGTSWGVHSMFCSPT
jgi:DMSO/TMAO reductase YedYZ molybdopterin-dependent catalytic subunit